MGCNSIQPVTLLLLSFVLLLIHRGGRAQQLMAYIEDQIPALPMPARKAAVDLIKRRPTFYPIPSWMYLSQMHGPQVRQHAVHSHWWHTADEC